MRTLGIIVLAIIAIPAGWFGSALVYEAWNTYTYRYRLTIELQTPEGVRSGSGVIEVSTTKKATWVPQTGGIISSIRGEAVYVDLDSRGILFILLSGEKDSDAASIARRAFASLLPKSPDPTVVYDALSKLRADAELRPHELPMVVTFNDLADPKSVRLVRSDDLQATFGPDVRLIHAKIELTREPITTGIEQKLPWLRNFRGVLGGQAQPDHLRPERNLSGNDFIQGMRR
jgi:hypothetical protein